MKLFDAVELEGSVFLEATANEFDLGDRQIGMVQTTELMFYEFVYAGRRDTEGSCKLDLKAGFATNPSLDVQSGPGQTIDDKIFDFATLLIDRVTTPKAGFNVKVRFGDHPNNAIPYRFQNGLTGARNFLALAARAQKFNVYLVTRANATAPVEILGRFNWAADWIVEFAWSVRTGKPTATTRRADILDGRLRQRRANPADVVQHRCRALAADGQQAGRGRRQRDLQPPPRAAAQGIPALAAGLPHQFLYLTPQKASPKARPSAGSRRAARRRNSGPRHEIVLADGEDGVHELLGRILLRQGRPGRVGDDGVLVEIVRRPQQGAASCSLQPLAWVLPSGARCPRRRHRHAWLMSSCWANSYLGLVQPADAQDKEFAVAERQGLLAEDVAGERRPALHQRRVMRQHLEDVEDLAVHGVLLDCGAVLRRHGREIAHGNALLALDHRVPPSSTGPAL